MHTYFAPPERQSPEELQRELKIISANPLIDALMRSVSGLLAVLDEHRQILAVNDSLLKMLGVGDSEKVLGLRPGEAIRCVHADEEPGGCGTSKFCSSCGAAIAIVTSLAHDSSEDRICAATVRKGGTDVDICFQVRATPIHLESHRFLLLFLQDITSQQIWAGLERVFFHDISNILTTLMNATEMLAMDRSDQELLAAQTESIQRLKQEIELQKALVGSRDTTYQVMYQEVKIAQLLRDLENFIRKHPVTIGKSVSVTSRVSRASFISDATLLKRILTNMLLNALEATPDGGEVRLAVEEKDGQMVFLVSNDLEIPEGIRRRIFQKHFSTREGIGRGLGTYSMKLFGEKFLQGRVDFTSSAESGTTFRLSLPQRLNTD